MRTILLIMIGFSLLQADFIRIGDVVKDTVSKLEWQDNNNTKTITKNWSDAIDYCENLNFDGHSDWRLPNINELKSIIDRSKSNPAIVQGFKNIISSSYWSSTTREDYKNYAWIVNFGDGSVYNDNKDYNYYVRCVRDGQ